VKNIVITHLLPLAVCLAALAFFLHRGQDLQTPDGLSRGTSAAFASGARLVSAVPVARSAQEAKSPIATLFIQLIVVVTLARLFGGLIRFFGQPAVVGEMIAGIVLGPSVLGEFFPGISHFLFPEVSLPILQLLSQIGVVLFMFVVGMEMDLEHLRSKAQAALLVAHIGITLPFALGVGAALFLFGVYTSSATRFMPFGLFIGVAMSITAFPVLARILSERKMTRTPLGVAALSCAALNDAAAWVILALVVAVVQAGSFAGAAWTLLFLIFFTVVLLTVVRFSFARLSARWLDEGRPGPGLTATVLIFVFVCSLITELAGVHALFGAFLAGIAVPQTAGFREHLRERLESFSAIFLLPIFFVFTGLRTRMDLVSGWGAWGCCALLVLVATVGKLGGSMVAARVAGMNWREAFCLGALMNTRGLVELIVLNVGYDMGILPPSVFAMLVAMAIVTTCLTGPLLTLGGSNQLDQPERVKPLAEEVTR
jgi:Kef-type K+ transport system membrane component KefB